MASSSRFLESCRLMPKPLWNSSRSNPLIHRTISVLSTGPLNRWQSTLLENVKQMPTGTERAFSGTSGDYYLAFKSKIEELDLGHVPIPPGLHMHIWRPQLERPLPPFHLHGLGKEKMLTLPSLIFFYLSNICRDAPRAYNIAIATNESQRVIGFVVLRARDF